MFFGFGRLIRLRIARILARIQGRYRRRAALCCVIPLESSHREGEVAGDAHALQPSKPTPQARLVRPAKEAEKREKSACGMLNAL